MEYLSDDLCLLFDDYYLAGIFVFEITQRRDDDDSFLLLLQILLTFLLPEIRPIRQYG
jgi:hypothetical protein